MADRTVCKHLQDAPFAGTRAGPGHKVELTYSPAGNKAHACCKILIYLHESGPPVEEIIRIAELSAKSMVCTLTLTRLFSYRLEPVGNKRQVLVACKFRRGNLCVQTP